VDQFIGFARSTDPASYTFSPLNLSVWLDEQIGAWESTGSAVRLVQPCPANLTVNADRLALGRLIDNLITNALNHASPPVEVALAQDGAEAVITIADHGRGISEDRRAEALRPFARLDEARTQTGSVGLGLALCEAIARSHHGSLQLGQAPSGGLLVTIRLPLHNAGNHAPLVA